MNAVLARPLMTLRAETAADLMVENPVSVREDASVHDAIVLFTKKGISAAPVIDAAGRPVGVYSRSDVIVHDRTKLEWPPTKSAETPHVDEDTMRVRELMTPAVFSVSPTTPVARVIRDILGLNVHRLFVVDDSGFLIGVISATDIIRHLHE